MEFERREEELTAADWKHMYCVLLKGIDAALSAETAFAVRGVLRKAVEEAEEYYISAASFEN